MEPKEAQNHHEPEELGAGDERPASQDPKETRQRWPRPHSDVQTIHHDRHRAVIWSGIPVYPQLDPPPHGPRHHDIDFKNCAPTFWVQITENALPGAYPRPMMRRYVDHREQVLAEDLGHIESGQAKTDILKITRHFWTRYE